MTRATILDRVEAFCDRASSRSGLGRVDRCRRDAARLDRRAGVQA